MHFRECRYVSETAALNSDTRARTERNDIYCVLPPLSEVLEFNALSLL